MPKMERTKTCDLSNHKPNKKTSEAIESLEKGKGLTEAKSAIELFKKLGIARTGSHFCKKSL